MAIVMRCPGCDTRFEFDAELEGKKIRCKNCGDMFRVERPAKPIRQKRRDDDEEDDRPRSRSDRDADDRDPPKKKLNPLFIVGGVVLLLLLVGVVTVLLTRGKKGSTNEVSTGDMVKAPAKTCALEVAEKEIHQIVVPDAGNIFGLLRKVDTARKKWVFEPYDVVTSRRLGRLDLNDQEEPQAVSLSPDGKHLLVQERDGFGAFGEHTVSIWSIADNKEVFRKWAPYPKPKAGGDPPTLFRAEFVGNDKIVTLSTSRVMNVWSFPGFEAIIANAAYVPFPRNAEQLGRDDRFGSKSLDKYQRQVAFTTDHTKMALWYGDGFVFVDCKEGLELFRTATMTSMGFERAKSGPVAFSPDGSLLAAVIEHNFRDVTLLVWDTKEEKAPTKYPLLTDQYKEAKGLSWWGNKYVVTLGASVEGMLVNIQSGLPTRQLMGSKYNTFSYSRDGRLWYATSGDETNNLATLHVIDAPDAELSTDPDTFEEHPPLKGTYLRRLWMEPTGLLRKPSRYDPPLQQRLLVVSSGR